MRKLIPLAAVAGLLVSLAGGIYYWYSTLSVNVSIQPLKKVYGENTTLTLNVNSNKEPPKTELQVYVEQTGRKLYLYNGPLKTLQRTVSIDWKKEGFKDGKVSFVAVLKTPFEERKVLNTTAQLDLTPPSFAVTLAPKKLRIGRPGLVFAQSNDTLKEFYVDFGGYAKFPLVETAPGEYKTFITAPLTALKHPSVFKVVAVDEAGNISQKTLQVELIPFKPKEKKIVFTKKELDKLLSKFFPQVTNPVEQFKIVNEKYRKEDEEKFKEICSQSENKLLISTFFLQMPGSAVKARFGEHRLYYLENQYLGDSYHKGMDLAKWKRSPVPAANDGKVVFVGDTKIYGKVVIIDHGLGLFSLYGHLNDFSVKPGQMVKRGQIIGHTDTTGFALGDHLHFGVLVWGYATDPYFYLIPWNMNHYIFRYFKQKVNKTSRG